MRYLGIDLAWGEGAEAKPANQTGVVALDPDGTIVDAGWTIGIEETVAWILRLGTADTLLFVDAPLLVLNPTRQRRCEQAVGQSYGKWKVSANSTNQESQRQAGVRLREKLEAVGWRYDDGASGPPDSGRAMSECYPYTALVGAAEFGYVTAPDFKGERPKYKRPSKGQKAAEWKPERAKNCDELIGRFATFTDVTPPINLRSHPTTLRLIDEPSPEIAKAYKQREDLLDAAICAWTAALWHQRPKRCQVLGADDPLHDPERGRATIIAPTPVIST